MALHVVDPALPCEEYPPRAPALTYPFALDAFQQHAIMAIERGDNVLVTAKTSAGKTAVAEYAIAAALRAGGRVMYTTPLKALSAQKFADLRARFPGASVGLVTGDIKVCPEADVVVLTAECLRNLLSRGASAATAGAFVAALTSGLLGATTGLSLDRVTTVVMDEAHYVNDPDRGEVWETTLLLLPRSVTLLLLSATLDGADAFGAWLAGARARDVVLVSTTHRVVPLVHGVLRPTGAGAGAGALDVLPLLDSRTGRFDGGAYTEWLRLRARAATAHAKFAADMRQAHTQAERAQVKAKHAIRPGVLPPPPQTWPAAFNDALRYLDATDALPALVFVMSRRGCEDTAALVSGSLVTPDVSAAIGHSLDYHLRNHRSTLERLPQYATLRSLLVRGIGYHHAGVLPVLREAVELLAVKALLRVVVCTSSLGTGLNLPARTVVFADTSVPDGDNGARRPLRADEYNQMAGRAGRRGLDTRGLVLHVPSREPPSVDELRAMLLGGLPTLHSRLRLHYATLLRSAKMSPSAPDQHWRAILDASYWAAVRRARAAAADATRASIEERRAQLATPEQITERTLLERRAALCAAVEGSFNAARRRALAELAELDAAHPAVAAAWPAFCEDRRLQVEAASVAATADTPADDAAIDAAVMARYAALAALGFTQEDSPNPLAPLLTPLGAATAALTEGHPLVMATVYDARKAGAAALAAVRAPADVIALLGLFVGCTGNDVKADEDIALADLRVPDAVRDAIAAVGDIVAHMELTERNAIAAALGNTEPMRSAIARHLGLEARRGRADDAAALDGVAPLAAAPPGYWDFTLLWVEVAHAWATGAEPGALCATYGLQTGTLLRGVLRLGALLGEWASLAAAAGDVEELDALRDAPSLVLRGFAVPDSLYLHL